MVMSDTLKYVLQNLKTKPTIKIHKKMLNDYYQLNFVIVSNKHCNK